jgi:hypothetical protein
MGAQSFLTSGWGNTPDEAYRYAVSIAHYEYGHDAYNGTISTTNGCIEIPLLDDELLDDWTERVLGDPRVRKWENCAYALETLDTTSLHAGPPRWHFAGWAAS